MKRRAASKKSIIRKNTKKSFKQTINDEKLFNIFLVQKSIALSTMNYIDDSYEKLKKMKKKIKNK